jgi:aryl-alcohol dehydrogenase-like predicted oxidoreductase
MEYRFLGRSGLKVSALSYGTWVTFGDQIGEETAAACLKTAYEAGVNFFDAAESYARGRAEVLLGKIIRDFGWKRSDLIVSTKIFWGGEGPNDSGLSRKHIVEGVGAALKRLQMDYVDLVFARLRRKPSGA